jgi:TolB-like protein/tetratricopeptide (TPR) repeat protein
MQRAAAPRAKRVVVAVFENQTGDSSLTRLGVLIADWITQGLQRTATVEVVPAGTLRPTAQSASPTTRGGELGALRQLARTTNADYVVNGTISLDGEMLRLQPQIIDAGFLRLVGAPAGVVVVRAELTRGIETVRQHVLGSLASVLDRRVASWAAAASNPPSLAAFSEFQIGLDALVSRHDAATSIGYFQRAADADSSYMVPRLWMIQALMRVKSLSSHRIDSVIASVERRRDRLAPADALLLDRLEAMVRGDLAGASRASVALARLAPSSYFVQMLAEDAAFENRPHEAVEILSRLDPQWPWVREWQEYWSLLSYELHATGDYQRELEVARRARATRPNSRRFLWLECQALAGLGRVDDVRALSATIDTLQLLEARDFAGDFKPDGFFRNVGLELRAHGHAEAAHEMFERADHWYSARMRVVPPSVADVHEHMLLSTELEHWSEAATAARAVLDSIPNDPMPTAILGMAAASLGDTARARQQLALLERRADGNALPVKLYEAAKVAVTLGDREHAIRLLAAAFAAGRRHTFWDHLAIAFEPLRARADYQRLALR